METIEEFTAAGTETEQIVEEQELFNFEEYRKKFDCLVRDWKGEIDQTILRRKIRKLEVNMDELRASGKLKADEVLINVRVIDENISKEKPVFTNYLTQSRRLAVFDCRSNPKLSGVEILETEFTKGMSYDGAIKNLVKVVDGAQAHGWDAIEVTFDPTKPLHCGLEQIGHENLLFPLDAKDLQACEYILRRFDVTSLKLKSFVSKHGFDATQVENLISTLAERQGDVPKNIEIYKAFIKKDDTVSVAWLSVEGNITTDWLKKPAPLSLGRRSLQQRTEIVTEMVDIPDMTTGIVAQTPVQRPKMVQFWKDETESNYPVKIYLYSETEEQCITDQRGRVFYDLPWQEAQIALRSLFINGAVRASNVYGSPDIQNQDGSPPKKMDLTLEHGCFYSQPMRFWSTEYPDPTILRAADALDVRKAAEMGQVASAVINRDDSRKTATELDKAGEEQNKIASVPLLFFSNFMRGVLGIAWYIVQSQAQQNLVIVAPMEIPLEQPGMTAGPKMITMNNPELINQVYDIKPAGDPDVVRKQERIQKRMILLPIVQPLGGDFIIEFVKDLIREMLPEDADKYFRLIQSDMAKNQAIMSLIQLLQAAVTDEQGKIKPEFVAFVPQLQKAVQIAQQLTQGGGRQNGPNISSPRNNTGQNQVAGPSTQGTPATGNGQTA